MPKQILMDQNLVDIYEFHDSQLSQKWKQSFQFKIIINIYLNIAQMLVKVKAKFPSCLTKYHVIKTYPLLN
jgi:hypothetical protein